MKSKNSSADKIYTLNSYVQKHFGEKLYKLSLNGGMTCPNRDGRLDTRGCIFCSRGGSGDFAASSHLSITEQIENAKSLISDKFHGSHYIAYFQAFTNTYAPVAYLRRIFTEAINHPDIRVLSIATRPDCLGDDIVALLDELNHIKPVWIELGLQTIKPETAAYIRRGYNLNCYESAIQRLHSFGIKVITHVILGLPGETETDMLNTIRYLNFIKTDGVKLQLLHVLKDTDLEKDYKNQKFFTLTFDEYIDVVIKCIEYLSPDIVVHRLTGDGPRNLLIAPSWSLNKKHVLNTINHELAVRGSYQGKEYDTSHGY